TGKTFTALKIAEKVTGGNGLVLVLVPSISLLGQTLREWCADTEHRLYPVCICSDATVKKLADADSFDSQGTLDLGFPSTTDASEVISHLEKLHDDDSLTVFFSTYQSIEVVHEVQEKLNREFDLIVCDEAHRTTGVTLDKKDGSAFVKVHENEYLKAKKRLYMTATPRLYTDSAKKKAELNDALLCSMDDEKLYGKEIYRYGFGQAVEDGELSDYRVLILTLTEKDIPRITLNRIRNSDGSLNVDDAARLVGCIYALSKQIIVDAEGHLYSSDPQPMKRAVAFCSKIQTSKEISNEFIKDSADLSKSPNRDLVKVDSKHIDGKMSAARRDSLLQWLKEDSNECRILTNARCLSEGVDVPALDAVLFLTPRRSQIDVVQSVGRVMRKAPGKKYGYIIIPVVIPSEPAPEQVLNSSGFADVWAVLNALRAHDDRFNSVINKISLNKKRPDLIQVCGIPNEDSENSESPSSTRRMNEAIQSRLEDFGLVQETVYARMVMKVGDRQYWEDWAGDVADIAQRQISRLHSLVKEADIVKPFGEFVAGLQTSINPSVNEDQAIEMLSQHMITKPIFEAIFEDASFVSHNPVSQSMQKMVQILEENGFDKDTKDLAPFYNSVKERCSGLDNAEARQKVIVELYNNFFKAAFPRMVEKLGITYTPVEVVDFILQSVDDV
ncbi:MAG TPA: DEAD/DEAH box helicase family protein, partial [Methanocorpusculum sp.]|nr:DEAD/DEAH box helicase family protein [Methanocorpusculum sp.]